MAGFTWLPFFEEMLKEICKKYDKFNLCKLSHEIFGMSGGLVDTFSDGSRGPLKEIDPLTFIGYFNRQISDKSRIRFCELAKERMGLNSSVPADFDAIPRLNNMNAWFFTYSKKRGEKDIDNSWEFARALNDLSLQDELFGKVLRIRKVGVPKLTVLMFICKPNRYISLDTTNINFFKSQNITTASKICGEIRRSDKPYSLYEQFLNELRVHFGTKFFYEISQEAYLSRPRRPPTGEKSEVGFPVNPPNNVWLEITHTAHKHGGRNWEFGTCLWTPSKDKGNRDWYAVMREVKKGDLVIHSNDSVLVGFSWAKDSFSVKDEQPPSPGQWANMGPYYRIDVENYTPFPRNVPQSSLIKKYEDRIREDIKRKQPFRYPFLIYGSSEKIRPIQGGYLARCSPALYQFIREIVYGGENNEIPPTSKVVSKEKYWVISPGEQARLWGDFRDNSIIAIGWDKLGDLRNYASKETIRQEIQKFYGVETSKTNAALVCYQFCKEMNIGDYVFAKEGTSKIIGYGRVISEYVYDNSRTEYYSIRKVQWLAEGSWVIPSNAKVTLKTLTDITNYKSFLDFILPLVRKKDKDEQEVDEFNEVGNGREPELFTKADALSNLFISEEEFDSILSALTYKKNVVLQGPPGVGKTFIAKRLAYTLIGKKDDQKVQMIQFHQSYSYEDFIQGYRPNYEGKFDLKNGTFYEFCKKAQRDKNNKYIFIIDEINRGNLSKIFGELMMLVEPDKRGPEYAVPLTYAQDTDEKFYISSNLYLLGTMNTADRSLAMVDYALRRRFSFIDLEPRFDSEKFKDFLINCNVEREIIQKIIEKMRYLNSQISKDEKNLGSGYRIGHSFFCPGGQRPKYGEDWYKQIVKHEIEPLIHEYWFDDKDKAESAIHHLLD